MTALRHFYVGGFPSGGTHEVCGRSGCARPADHPIHVQPGDRLALDAAMAETDDHCESITGNRPTQPRPTAR